MPPHIFQKLNEKLLLEKEEIKEALSKAIATMPKRIDYKDKILHFTDAVNALKDPDIPSKIKNEYLKEIIEKITVDRKYTKAPYEIRIDLRD